MNNDFLSSMAYDQRNMEMYRYLKNNAYIRVVNYHHTHPVDAEKFEREFAAFRKHFSAVTVADMDRFFATGKWHKEKPGLIPAIFEGFRDHYDVIYPILEKYGFTGWFYIPAFFADVPVREQVEFANLAELDIMDTDLYADGRVAMNWDELREIAKHHEICCHTGSHFQIGRETPDHDMFREIVVSKRCMEQKLGKPVDVFCWLYGEEFSYNVRAQKYLRQAGYRYVVSNLKMEKIG